MGASTHPVRQHITLGNWMLHVCLSSLFILLKDLFNHTRSPPLRQWSLTWGDIPALAPVLNELECAGWAGPEGQACGPIHPTLPSLALLSHTPWPEPTPPSWAVTRCAAGLCRMNRHSHIALGSVLECVCVHVYEREAEAEGGGGCSGVVLDVNSCSQSVECVKNKWKKQLLISPFKMCMCIFGTAVPQKLISWPLIGVWVQRGSAANPSGPAWPLCLRWKQCRPQSLLLLLLPWFI